MVVVAASTMAIAGCDAFSPAAKYGGPPNWTPSVDDAAASAPEASDAAAFGPPSPRLEDAHDGGRVHAPAMKYGLAPRPNRPLPR